MEKLEGSEIFHPSKGKVIKKLNYQNGRSHKFKPSLYDSFTLLKVPKYNSPVLVQSQLEFQ